MKVNDCGDTTGMAVSPKTYNACTFQIIDKWDPDQHAKTCDTMFYLSDGTGAYVWDCDKWTFLDFTGATESDWTAEENEEGYIKNKPFKTLGNGLAVDENGALIVTVTGNVKPNWRAKSGMDSEILNQPFKTLGDNLEVDENGVLNVTVNTGVTSINGKTGDVDLTVNHQAFGTDGNAEIDGTNIVVSAEDSRTVAQAIKESGGGTATEAEKLSTARDLKVDLTSKLAQSFDGSADADEIGVTGTLPIANGGTGNTTGTAVSLTMQDVANDTDLNTIVTPGMYVNRSNTTTGLTNFPEGLTAEYFMLEVYATSANTVMQRYWDSVGKKLFIRGSSGNPSTFSSWAEITNQNNSTNVPLTDGTVNSAATNPVLKYRILNDVIYISGSIDVTADGSMGESIKVGNIPVEYQPQKAINGVGKIHLKVGELSETSETAQVVVVGDENSAAKGAVMFSVNSSAKLTAGTWTFFGSYNLI